MCHQVAYDVGSQGMSWSTLGGQTVAFVVAGVGQQGK